MHRIDGYLSVSHKSETKFKEDTMQSVGARVQFTKRDLLLWKNHNPWLSEAMMLEGLMLRFNNGAEVLFQPTTDGRSLKPIKDATTEQAYAYWVKGINYGEIVDAEIL
jgi:hypothetical protein